MVSLQHHMGILIYEQPLMSPWPCTLFPHNSNVAILLRGSRRHMAGIMTPGTNAQR